tara:strand:- start:6358 stop:7170 length:813 start_codon:yes stop_codon:yes gene_type:complete
LFSVFIGCKKEVFEPDVTQTEELGKRADSVYQVLQNTGSEELMAIKYQVVHDAMREVYKGKNRGVSCYDLADLFGFLSEYGSTTPDYIPVWNNYFQDANCSVAQWQYLSKERGEGGIAENTDITPDKVIWTVSGADFDATETEGTLKFVIYTTNLEGDTIPNTDCSGVFQPPCNGTHPVDVTVNVGVAVYQRSNISHGRVNKVPSSIAPACTEYSASDVTNSSTFDFDCFCPIVFDEFEFLIDDGLVWDLNGDHYVSVEDLMILLVGYGC